MATAAAAAAAKDESKQNKINKQKTLNKKKQHTKQNKTSNTHQTCLMNSQHQKRLAFRTYAPSCYKKRNIKHSNNK